MLSRTLCKLRAPLLGAGVAALILASTGAASHLGSLQLGHANSADAQTSLTASIGTPVLKVINNGAGAALRGDAVSGIAVNGVSVSGTGQRGQSGSGIGLLGFHSDATGADPGVQGQTNSTDPLGAGVLGKNTGGGPGLRAIVNAGAPPLMVNSQVRVTNLNADKLDNLDSFSFWKLGGNAGTVPGTDFLGTSDGQALVFKTNNVEAMRLDAGGSLGIGTGSPAEKLDVTGNIRAAGTLFASQGFEGVTFPPAGWTTGGNESWVRDTTTFFEGAASATSGPVGNLQSSFLDADVSFTRPGVVRFRWKVSSEPTFDFLRFCLDNDACTPTTGFVRRISGEVDWTEVIIPVSAGAHSFRWVYQKDDFVANGSDKGWVDSVRFERGGGVFAGNVGIGTSTPTNALSVKGSGDFTGSLGVGIGAPENGLNVNGNVLMGRRAKSERVGSFVWADSTDADFTATGNNQFDVRAAGGVKIIRALTAFSFTNAALSVETGGTGGEAGWLRIKNATSTLPVLKLLKQPSGTGHFLQCSNFDDVTETPKCHIDAAGTFVAGSDFAESLPARGGKAGYAAGDVLSISRTHAGQVVKSQRAFDPAVIGVYSTRPAVLGADKGGVTRVGKQEIPVAITGIVPVKVTTQNGAIRPGDLLTSSRIPGRAMNAGRTPAIGTVLGKALGFLPRGHGTVKMLVMPR
jgi:hypothetical protein